MIEGLFGVRLASAGDEEEWPWGKIVQGHRQLHVRR